MKIHNFHLSLIMSPWRKVLFGWTFLWKDVCDCDFGELCQVKVKTVSNKGVSVTLLP